MPSTPSVQSSSDWSGATPSLGPPSPHTPLVLAGLEFSLSTATLDALEQVTWDVSSARVSDWFARSPGVEEVARVATCHRVELFLVARSYGDVATWSDRLPGDREAWRLREGRAAVRHLFRVAAGLESLARGEVEVRRQVRLAGASVESRHPRPLLRRTFGAAISAADAVYPASPASRSIAAFAVDRLFELTPVARPRVLVIGSGTVGQQVLLALAGRADVTVAFHVRPPDGRLLRATGARAVPLDRLAEELPLADAVVSAAKFGHRGLRADDLPSRRPQILIDLGVPRNIDPDVRSRPGAHLVDLEDLHARVAPGAAVPADEGRIEELADRHADEMARWLLEPWIGAIRRAAEETRRAELQHARRFLGRLDPDQELAVDRLTRRLVDQLLLAPTAQLRALPPGPEGDARRRLAVELLHPRPSGP